MDWLHFIGKTYYPTSEVFEDEAVKDDVSRRIGKHLMKNLNFNDRVFLFQKEKGEDHSVMFGYFTVDSVLGSSMDRVLEELKEKGKIKSSKKEKRNVVRKCGHYRITDTHDVSTSLPEIVDKIKPLEGGDLMIGGSYTPKEKILTEVAFQRGFRPFDYETFKKECIEIEEKGAKMVEGQFRDEVKKKKPPEVGGKIIQFENYMKQPTSQTQAQVVDEHREEFLKGKIEPESIPKEKFSISEDKKEKSYLINVFYGTDRNEVGGDDLNKFYGTERANLSYGVCKVRIPYERHKVGEIKRPKWWRFEFKENPKKHFILMSILPKSADDFRTLLYSKVKNSEDKDAFVFVHGYNVSFSSAAMRTAQITFDIGFQGAPIMYSWPSKDELSGYMGDGDDVRATIPHLTEFLTNILKWSGAKKIHLIAHSMGNVCLTEAILDVERRFKGKALFNNIILASPDIDKDIFKNQIAPNMTQYNESIKRITMYASSRDRALSISRIMRRNKVPRAGEGGRSIVVFPGIDSIDASLVGTNLLGHNFFAEAPTLINDLFSLIQNELPPERRNLRKRVKNGLDYWLLPRVR